MKEVNKTKIEANSNSSFNLNFTTTINPFPSNEGPLQRDEVKAIFNKDDSNSNSCKFIIKWWKVFNKIN